MPAIVIGPGDLGSCVLIPHREREIACLCKCQTRRIIEQLPLDLAQTGLVAVPTSVTVRSIAGQRYDSIIKQNLGELPTEALEEAPF